MRIDVGGGSVAIPFEKRKVRLHHRVRSLPPARLAGRLRHQGMGCTVFGAPVVRKSVTVNLQFAEPVIVPVADRDLVEPVVRLLTGERLQERHLQFRTVEVGLLSGGEEGLAA